MIVFLRYYRANSNAATGQKKTIGIADDFLLTTLVNSATGLPPKMAKFCHTSNRLLVGHQHRCGILQLHLFPLQAVGRLLGQSVGPQ
jgi:hypothetical protein